MARQLIKSFSLTRLCAIAIATFVLAAIASVIALHSLRVSATDAVDDWRRFADEASAEQRVLRTYITLTGVGGMADDYARLVATGDETLAPLIYARGGAALATIAAYPVADASTAEKQALAALQNSVKDHLQRVQPILAMHRSRADMTAIAQAAATPSDEARRGLLALSARVKRGLTPGVDSKAIITLDMRQALGMTGYTQHANAFVGARKEADRLQAVAALRQAREALARYRKHSLSLDETAALAGFETELNAVEVQLGGDSRLISMRGVQAALARIESIIYAEAVTAQNNLQGALGAVTQKAGAIIILVAAGALALTLGSIWLLAFRIGRRIKALTRTMRALAAGQLDVEIPAAHDRDEIGEMSRALLVFRDGLRANDKLTHELAESSRLASLGAMVAGMAHELNTPLGNALSVSSSLEEQAQAYRKELSSDRVSRSALERHGEQFEEAAALIQRNLTRASQHIGAFKQMAVDQTSGQRRQFLLDDVLRNTVQSLAPMIKRTPFHIEIGPASGVVMDGYPGALSQVVTNLVENALKHGLDSRPAGKVRIDVERITPDQTRIVVADDGAGIPAELMPRIFKAFFTTRAGKGGSGLGLHICKTIVSGPMGGDITVESEEGAGARFIIELPNVAPEGGREPEAATVERAYYAAQAAA